jgi:hypothetical protein
MNYRSFILYKKVNENWIQLDVRIINLYEFDEVLRRITGLFSTKAFFAYNQTTSGDFRFALFENNRLQRSLYQKYIDFRDETIILDNFGKKLDFEEEDYSNFLGKKIALDQKLDYDVFSDWYRELGFIWDGRDDEEAICLKILGSNN